MLRSWRDRLAVFWTWWMGELKGILTRGRLVSAPGFKSYREIRLQDDHWEVSDILRGKAGETRKPLGILSNSVNEERPSILLARKNQPLVLALPAEKCFLHSMEVPRAALSRIDQFLGLELSRVTPFTASQVLTGWFETPNAGSGTHANVSQVIARNTLVAPILALLAQWKLPLAGIFVLSADGQYLPARLANPALAFGDKHIGRWRKLAGAASLFAALCILAGLWSAFDRRAAELADLAQRTDIAQKKAVEVRKRLAVMETSSQRIVDLKAAKLNAPSILAVWEELTRVIPDTAWVSSLAVDKAQVTIEGNARSPEELIALLDASPLFESVAFNAPVTKLPGNDLTRFVIRLSLSRKLHVSSAAP